MTYQLIELTCSGCEKPFMVHLEKNSPQCLCGNCRSFKAAMEHLMRHDELPSKPNPLFKGLFWATALVGPFWIMCLYFWLR